MERHRLFQILHHTVNTLLFFSLAALLCGVLWEFSTRSYLKGFSDAIVPVAGTPEQKVEFILDWMVHKPARDTTTDPRPLTPRNPRESLHYEQLLQVCGTATNAFVNLAASNGVRARRLLLLSPDHQTKHVVAEVWLRDRWVIADPLYRILYHDAQGEFLTKEQLRDPVVFKEATQAIPGYLEIYTYELTSYVHLGRIPVIGDKLQSALNSIFPRWQEAFDWTLLLERGSFALTVIASLLLFCSLVARLIVNWYGDRRVPIPRVRLHTGSAV